MHLQFYAVYLHLVLVLISLIDRHSLVTISVIDRHSLVIIFVIEFLNRVCFSLLLGHYQVLLIYEGLNLILIYKC